MGWLKRVIEILLACGQMTNGSAQYFHTRSFGKENKQTKKIADWISSRTEIMKQPFSIRWMRVNLPGKQTRKKKWNGMNKMANVNRCLHSNWAICGSQQILLQNSIFLERNIIDFWIIVINHRCIKIHDPWGTICDTMEHIRATYMHTRVRSSETPHS